MQEKRYKGLHALRADLIYLYLDSFILYLNL
jgi:hypothetical protein